MKRLVFSLILSLSVFLASSQAKSNYYLEFKPHANFELVKTTVNSNATVTIHSNINSIDSLLNKKKVSSFKKAFPTTHKGFLIGGGVSNNYILEKETTQKTLNLSTYSTGVYIVSLVCDGRLRGSKNLVIR